MRTKLLFPILLLAMAVPAQRISKPLAAKVVTRAAALAVIQHNVALSWNASTTTGATYNVYRGATCPPAQSSPIASSLTSLTYTDGTVVNGTTYAYAVSAFTTAGGESAESNCVSVQIPSQTAPPSALSFTVN